MRDLDTIIGSKTGTAIKVGGLFVPANSIAKHFQRFTDPGLFHSEGAERYHLSKSGSLFRLTLRNRYFAFTTQHQFDVGKYNYEQLCIMNHETKKMCNSHQAVYQIEKDDDAISLDCVLFEFSEAVAKGDLPRNEWYPLDAEYLDVSLPKPTRAFTIGYPAHRNDIDYDAATYQTGSNAVWGRETTPKIRGRLAFQPEPKVSFDPKGMSGGPVFGIHLNHLEPVAFFAGILTNASKSRFHFTPRTNLTGLFKRALD